VPCLPVVSLQHAAGEDPEQQQRSAADRPTSIEEAQNRYLDNTSDDKQDLLHYPEIIQHTWSAAEANGSVLRPMLVSRNKHRKTFNACTALATALGMSSELCGCALASAATGDSNWIERAAGDASESSTARLAVLRSSSIVRCSECAGRDASSR